MNEKAALVFDIGGTKMRAAMVLGGMLGEPVSVATPQDFNEGMDALEGLARRVLRGREVSGVIAGVAGVRASDRRSLFRSTNLPGWEGMPLAGEMERRLGAAVVLENDAACGALGEAHEGAGKGKRIVAYITVSTGVGGARVVDGALDAYAGGFEPGDQFVSLVQDDGEANIRLEDHVSGTAVVRRYGVDPRLLPHVEVDRLARVLARGLHNSILHWSPDILVLGGSMMLGVNPLPLPLIESSLRETLSFLPVMPALALAKLGDAAGLHGAAVLAARR